eukprot:9487055-Pyramimonas_sp.AAC.1
MSRGPVRNSTEGLGAAVRMWAKYPCRRTPHTFRGTVGSSTEGPNRAVRMWVSHPFRHTPHTLRSPIGSSREGPKCCSSPVGVTPVSAHPSHAS